MTETKAIALPSVTASKLPTGVNHFQALEIMLNKHSRLVLESLHTLPNTITKRRLVTHILQRYAQHSWEGATPESMRRHKYRSVPTHVWRRILRDQEPLNYLGALIAVNNDHRTLTPKVRKVLKPFVSKYFSVVCNWAVNNAEARDKRAHALVEKMTPTTITSKLGRPADDLNADLRMYTWAMGLDTGFTEEDDCFCETLMEGFQLLPIDFDSLITEKEIVDLPTCIQVSLDYSTGKYVDAKMEYKVHEYVDEQLPELLKQLWKLVLPKLETTP